MSFTRRNLLLLAAVVGIAAGPAAAYAEGVLNVGSYPNNPPFEFKAESGNFRRLRGRHRHRGGQAHRHDRQHRGLRLPAAVRGDELGPHRRRDFLDHHHAGAPEVAVLHPALLRFRHGHRRQDRQPHQGPCRPQGQDRRRAVRLDRARPGPRSIRQSDGFAEVKGYNTQQDLLLDLGNGRVDAVVSDIPGMEYAFTKMQGLAVKERIKTGEQYGLMMTKDHAAARQAQRRADRDEEGRHAGGDPQEVVRQRRAGGLFDRHRNAHAQGLSNPPFALTIVPARAPARSFEYDKKIAEPASGSRRRSLAPCRQRTTGADDSSG